MKITYKVIDTRTNEDITDRYDWVIQPNGRLAYNAYGDLIGLTYAEAVFTVDDIEQKRGKWIDVSVASDKVRWKCSVCGKKTDLPNYDKADFCFNCGAKMLKEKN